MTTTKVLWFVLAGFLLGFTFSTLWEWFHFRRVRLRLTDRRIRELEEQLSERDEENSGGAPEETDFAWSDPAYRSPGVFLETENVSAAQDERARRAPPPAAEPPARPVPDLASATTASSTRRTPLTADPGRARRAEALAALRRTSEAMQRAAESKPDVRQGREETPLASFVPATEAPAPEESSADATDTMADHWSRDPELTRRSDDHPDDLSKIRGIGDVYKQRLYRAGIYTWHQIATADANALRRATSAYPSSNVEEWPEQATKLAERSGRTGALYAGPQPDDFTQIHGIGPVGRQSLYRAGICTFEQLATTPAEELATLFPIAVAGDQPDFDRWITQAARLADSKHANESH